MHSPQFDRSTAASRSVGGSERPGARGRAVGAVLPPNPSRRHRRPSSTPHEALKTSGAVRGPVCGATGLTRAVASAVLRDGVRRCHGDDRGQTRICRAN